MACRLPSVLLAASALALPSCNLFVSVPPESAGDMAMSLRSALDHDLCEFSMTPRGAPTPSGNWLKHEVGPGAARSFKIKPGDYHVELGCPGQFHGAADLHLVASTEIHIGVPADARRYAAPFIAVTGNVGALAAPVTSRPVSEAPPPEGQEEAAPKRECWPDGHPCQYLTDPCCNTCGHNPNTNREECY